MLPFINLEEVGRKESKHSVSTAGRLRFSPPTFLNNVRLKGQSGCDLNNPCSLSALEPAKKRIVKVRYQAGKTSVIEGIKHVSANLELDILSDVERFRHAEIEVPLARGGKLARAGVTRPDRRAGCRGYGD